jgi:hypothetical protein
VAGWRQDMEHNQRTRQSGEEVHRPIIREEGIETAEERREESKPRRQRRLGGKISRMSCHRHTGKSIGRAAHP